jgi:hypothetical protein
MTYFQEYKANLVRSVISQEYKTQEYKANLVRSVISQEYKTQEYKANLVLFLRSTRRTLYYFSGVQGEPCTKQDEIPSSFWISKSAGTS